MPAQRAAPRALAILALASVAGAQVVQQKVEGSGPGQGDSFGLAVAISGNWAAVGAPFADDVLTDSGATYVFERTSTGWVERQRFKASDPSYGAGFGGALAMDGARLVVGAPGAAFQGMTNVGGIYIFENLGGVWTQTQKLVPNDANVDYGFGYSVALSGNRLIGGAIGEWHSGLHTGAAYIFESSAGMWAQIAKLVASDAAYGDDFGWSVALNGDVAVAGAVGAQIGSMGSVGAAYVYERQGALWPQTQKLVPANPWWGDYFGITMAVDGDSILIGAMGADTGLPNGGAVHVFQHPGASWLLSQILYPTDLASGGFFFGRYIAASNGRAVIAASASDIPPSVGSAYLFTEIGSTWLQSGKLIAPDVLFGDNFGTAVAIGGTTVVVGDAQDDDACISDPTCDSGSAYLFEFTPGAAQYGSCGSTSPCANTDGHGGCRNSTGQGAVLAACGTNSIGADDLVLEARWLPPGVHAIGFMGRVQSSVFLGDGLRVAAPGFGAGLYRLPLQAADSSGVLHYGPGLVALSQGFPPAGRIQPGVQWNFQVWYRDVAGPCGSGTNTTNGVSVDFAP